MNAQPTILVIEPDSARRERLRSWLADEAYDPIVAWDGASARAAAGNRPDAIIVGSPFAVETGDRLDQVAGRLDERERYGALSGPANGLPSETRSRYGSPADLPATVDAADSEEFRTELLNRVRRLLATNRDAAPATNGRLPQPTTFALSDPFADVVGDATSESPAVTDQPTRGGVIAGTPLETALKFFHLGGLDCDLQVIDAAGDGWIHFLAGELVDARCHGLTGEEAVYRMLSWPDARIEFGPLAYPPERRIDLPLPILLLATIDHHPASVGDFDAWTDPSRQLAWQTTPGFVAGIALATVLQVLHLDQSTCELHVLADEREGWVYLQDGEVIDAEGEGLAGEDALVYLLTWPDASIEIGPPVGHRDRRITVALSIILMETASGARTPATPVHRDAPEPFPDRVEDAHPAAIHGISASDDPLASLSFVEVGTLATNVPEDWGEPPPSASRGEPLSLVPPPADQGWRDEPVVVESPAPRPRDDGLAGLFNPRLAAASAIGGVLAAAVVDGQRNATIASFYVDHTIDLEAAIVPIGDVLRATNRVRERAASDGDIEDLVITLEDQYHLIRVLEPDGLIFLYVVLDRAISNLALARRRLATIA